MNGLQAAEKIRETSDIPIIFISGYSNSEMKSRAMRTGPVAYLEKPVDTLEINRLLKDFGR
jgi:CheY-like chemotaxis protein